MQLFEVLVVFLYKYSYYRKLPFREYALPLKRERWHAKRAGEGATCRGGFANARRDAHINVSVIKKAGIKCSLLKFLVVSRSAFYCGANVPDETGKMSRSDKRGATCQGTSPKAQNDCTYVPVLQSSGLPRSLRSLAMTE